MANTIKMRRFEFRRFDINEDTLEKTTIKRGFFDYYATAKDILTAPAAGSGGMSTEEIVTAVSAHAKIKSAWQTFQALGEIPKDNPQFDARIHRFPGQVGFVFIDNETYQFFLTRMNSFRWALAHEVVADFIKYVRELKEEDVDVSAKT